jgi:hypothetical protein
MNMKKTGDKRRWAARIALIGIVLGAIFILEFNQPVELNLSYQIAPSLRATPRNVTRRNIRSIQTFFENEVGEVLGTMQLFFPEGLGVPVTHAGRIALPTGDYTARIHVTSRSGQLIKRHKTVTFQEAGTIELPLR